MDAPIDTPAPTPGVLVAGHYECKPGFAGRRRRGTHDWLLTYTLEGAGRYCVAGLVVETGPGDAALLPPGVPHDYSVPPGGHWEFMWAHFLPRPAWGRLLQWPLAVGGLHLVSIGGASDRARTGAAFRRLLAEAQTGRAQDMFTEELALNALEEVLLLCAREAVSDGQRAVDARVGAVLDALAADLTVPHSVAELAAQVALSPSRLAHLFKAQTGSSLLEAALQLRLREAARLLTYTVLEVKEISHAVGFHSPYHFSRQFRRRFGLSPSAYRARMAGQPPCRIDRVSQQETHVAVLDINPAVLPMANG